jgi:biotin synthase
MAVNSCNIVTMSNEIFEGHFDFDKIKYFLSLEDKNQIQLLFDKARETRDKTIGNIVYLRGLIEYSNRCAKNCFYCGIRGGNTHAVRYQVSDDEVVEAAIYAYKHRYGSIVLQSGERSDREFVNHISSLIQKIHKATDNKLRITLSCGEQSPEVYSKWLELGVKRYLLRIEASNPDLYSKIHPADHSFQERLKSLKTLIDLGFQTGTGVMIGLPFQTIDDLANDLLFIRDSGVVMIGMGPYIEHAETPLFQYRDILIPQAKRVELTLKMTAILRLMIPTINIASTTALQTLDVNGRELGLMAGANVIMPNVTPTSFKQEYNLYEGKPGLHDEPDEVENTIEKIINSAGCVVGWDDWGDSKYYSEKNKQ